MLILISGIEVFLLVIYLFAWKIRGQKSTEVYEHGGCLRRKH